MTLPPHRPRRTQRHTPNALLVARHRVGANTDLGRLYSGMIEASQSYRKEGHPTARAHLVQYMAWCRDQLARLRDVQ